MTIDRDWLLATLTDALECLSDSIDRSIRTAELSLRMEGFSVTDACKELCRKLLAGEITLQEYLTQVISGEGKA